MVGQMNARVMQVRSVAQPGPNLFVDPVLSGAGFLIVLSIATTLPALLVDQRQFQGASVWLKPLKFQIALAIYLLTLSFYARWLPDALRQSRRYRAYVTLIAGTAMAELIWVASAGLLGAASHYNKASVALMSLYAVMGVLAVILTSATLVFGVVILRDKASTLRSDTRLAIGLGLILTFALTIPAAGILSAGTGHGIGVPHDAARLPVLGWTRAGGDLRVAHFFATHALHMIPLAGLVIGRIWPVEQARRWIIVAAVTYAGLVAFTLGQALMARPFLT